MEDPGLMALPVEDHRAEGKSIRDMEDMSLFFLRKGNIFIKLPQLVN